MKPTAERYQAATQVNGVSPEIVLIEKADRLQVSGRLHGNVRKGEDMTTFPGSQTAAWYRTDRDGTWETLAGPCKGYLQTSRKGKDAEMSARESDSLIVLRAWESHVHGEGGCIVV
jgi:hypothetical protein